jgi:hypothetical protein
MNDAINTWPQYVGLEVLFSALIVFLAMRLTHKALDLYIEQRGGNPLVHRFFPMVEGGVWFLFCVWVVHHGFQAGAQSVLLILILGSGLLIWAARFAVSDWTAGIIFRGEDRYRVGDRVRFNAIEGVISHFGYRSLTLETADGRSVEIPYGTLVKDTHLEKYPSRKACASFTLTVPSQAPFPEMQARLRTLVLSAPWTLINQPPRITLVKRMADSCTVDIMAYLTDPSYSADLIAYMEKYLESVSTKDLGPSDSNGL